MLPLISRGISKRQIQLGEMLRRDNTSYEGLIGEFVYGAAPLCLLLGVSRYWFHTAFVTAEDNQRKY